MGFLQVIFYFILRVELTKLHLEETGENVKFENFSEMSNCFVYCCLLCWCVATGTQFCGLANVFFSARWRFGTFHRGITKPFL